jgi:dienelactone hydrolase
MKILSLLVLIAACAFVTNPAFAEIKMQRIEYRQGDTTMQGFFAYDDSTTQKRPGILVCHEWWGCNDYAQSRAKQLAAAGYVAFALDMYGDGRTTSNPSEAGELSSKLYSNPTALRDRAAAGLKVLAESDLVDRENLAVIGYCMGGTVALELARSGATYTDHLKAVVCFHTSTIAAKSFDDQAKEDNSRIAGTILICHGADDTFVSPEQIASFRKQMKDIKKDYQFVEYANAVHGFTNPGADTYRVPGVGYNAAADRRSWALMKSTFAEVFAKPQPKPAPAKKS